MPSKPEYEYDIQQFCYGNWEVVNCEPTRAEALRSLKEYRENQPEFPYRVKRVKAEE